MILLTFSPNSSNIAFFVQTKKSSTNFLQIRRSLPLGNRELLPKSLSSHSLMDRFQPSSVWRKYPRSVTFPTLHTRQARVLVFIFASGVQPLPPCFFLRGWVHFQQCFKAELSLEHWVGNPDQFASGVFSSRPSHSTAKKISSRGSLPSFSQGRLLGTVSLGLVFSHPGNFPRNWI